jgi:hypothetical protein
MNMNNVTIQLTKHQKEAQNLSKKLEIITYPSTLKFATEYPPTTQIVEQPASLWSPLMVSPLTVTKEPGNNHRGTNHMT